MPAEQEEQEPQEGREEEGRVVGVLHISSQGSGKL